jgi:hypothetical protein
VTAGLRPRTAPVLGRAAAATGGPLVRAASAELLGSLLLAALVIGSGIAAQRLSPADVGLQLVENAAATAVGLFAIILMFSPVSGGHFNPVVSLAGAVFGGLPWRYAVVYIPAQIVGCVAGAVLRRHRPHLHVAVHRRPTRRRRPRRAGGAGLYPAVSQPAP